jgi:spore coat protein H
MVILRRRILRRSLLGGMVAWLSLGAAIGAVEGAAKLDPSDDLFTNAIVRHLSIEITDADMDLLRRTVPRHRSQAERPSVPATVREGELVWTNVSLHLKGAAGSFRSVDDKPALTLNFDKLADGQRFHGLQKISLNNSVQDPSYLHEKICRDLFRAAGVPVPRSDYATVELNGRRLGLFVLVEGWNKQFLRRSFTNVKGNFYEPALAVDIDVPRAAEFGENPTNHTALLALIAAARLPDPTERVARLRQTLDLDRFLTHHALDVMMWNWDGYALGRNNYRFFHDLAASRMVFFPHGLDQMFWKPNGPIMTGRSGLVAKSLLETTEGRRLYLERFAQLRTNILDVAAITNRIAALAARLKPALWKDGVFGMARGQQAALRFRELIIARAADIDAQLESVKTFKPLALDMAVALTNWISRSDLGEPLLNRAIDAPAALHIRATNGLCLGVWTTTLWLEEGRYRIEGRMKTLGISGKPGDERGERGAGFRAWSTRKESQGANWSWFPYGNNGDWRMIGAIPAFSETPQQRLTGEHDWTAVTHEFELRQPLADVQLQCVLQSTDGEAWFELSSLRLRRMSLTVSRSTEKGN